MKQKIIFLVLLALSMIAWTQQTKDTIINLGNGTFIKGKIHSVHDSVLQGRERDTILYTRLLPFPKSVRITTRYYSHVDSIQGSPRISRVHITSPEKSAYVVGIVVYLFILLILFAGAWLLFFWFPSKKKPEDDEDSFYKLTEHMSITIFFIVVAAYLMFIFNMSLSIDHLSSPTNSYSITLFSICIVSIIIAACINWIVALATSGIFFIIKLAIFVINENAVVHHTPLFMKQYLWILGACIVLGGLIWLVILYIQHCIIHGSHKGFLSSLFRGY